MLYAKFQPSTMSRSGKNVCGGGGGWVGVETNYSVKLELLLKLNNTVYKEPSRTIIIRIGESTLGLALATGSW